MKKLDMLFLKYAHTHSHPTNQLLHWICIPLIAFSLLGLLYLVPLPVNLAYVFIGVSLSYYFRLSIPLLIGMILGLGVTVALIHWVTDVHADKALWIFTTIFVVSWIGQFIGHAIEGKKPSFFEDIQYFLIGPLWLMGKFYKRVGWKF